MPALVFQGLGFTWWVNIIMRKTNTNKNFMKVFVLAKARTWGRLTWALIVVKLNCLRLYLTCTVRHMLAFSDSWQLKNVPCLPGPKFTGSINFACTGWQPASSPKSKAPSPAMSAEAEETRRSFEPCLLSARQDWDWAPVFFYKKNT